MKLQQDGGFQNIIVFAEREPIIAPNIWDEIALLKYNEKKVSEETETTESFIFSQI